MKTYTLEGIIQKTIIIEIPGYSLEIKVIPNGLDVRCNCWEMCPENDCAGRVVHKAEDHDCGNNYCDAVDRDAQCIPVEQESELDQ